MTDNKKLLEAARTLKEECKKQCVRIVECEPVFCPFAVIMPNGKIDCRITATKPRYWA